MTLRALTRAPSDALATAAAPAAAPAAIAGVAAVSADPRDPAEAIDLAKARAQHGEYEMFLRCRGAELEQLPADPDLPHASSIADTALVLDEVAVIAAMAAPDRARETSAVAGALSPYRRLLRLAPPAAMQGGDVLRIDRELFVGVSARTNEAAVDQLARLLAPFDYRVRPVRVAGGVRLRQGVSYVGRQTIVINPAWIDPAPFAAFERIDVPEEEPLGADILQIRYGILLPTGFVKTAARLVPRNFLVSMIDIAELAKAQAGLTSLSLLFTTET